MNTSPKESYEQKALFEWIAYAKNAFPELELAYAIPNGGSRDIREAHNLRLQGVKSGVPDICLPIPRGDSHGLYIELKRVQGGRIRPEQREWIEKLRQQGYQAYVCYGAEEAINRIKRYLICG